MKRLLWGTVIGLVIQVVTVDTQGHTRKSEGSRTAGSVHITFSTREIAVIRDYYAPRYRSLPPGLQKKLARTGQLPPGWQKKFEPFPADIERRLVTLPAGYRRGVVDGHAVIFDDRTHVLIDATVLF